MSQERAPNFIDFSQFWAWHFCNWNWFEKYVNKRRKKFEEGRQRDDAMALGSLVHDGLQGWYEHGVPEITQRVIEEINPSPDCFALANVMLQGYVRQYPVELWELQKCEEPVRAPLLHDTFNGLTLESLGSAVDMLAKIDSYFLVPELLPINSGIDGYDLVLEPGYWIQEFKTKAQSIDRGKWIKTWDSNMQADFQLLCLRHHLRGEALPVQGVLVSVLEKPKPYIPKRKCKVCDEQYPLKDWKSAPPGAILSETNAKGNVTHHKENLGCCPECGNLQVLKPYEPKKAPSPPSYFRIKVTRNDEQLAVARQQIEVAASRMAELREGRMNPEAVANKTNCSKSGWEGTCAFYRPHRYRTSTLEDGEFETPPDYVSETPELISIDV